MKGRATVLSFPTMAATIYLSTTRKSYRKAEHFSVKGRRSSTRLGKAKRTVLVRSKYGPAEAEHYVVKTTNPVFRAY